MKVPLSVMRLDRPAHVFAVEEIKDENRDIMISNVSSKVIFTLLGNI